MYPGNVHFSISHKIGCIYFHCFFLFLADCSRVCVDVTCDGLDTMREHLVCIHSSVFQIFYDDREIKLLFHLIWKNYILYWDFDFKSWIVDFFTCFTHKKIPQNNFSPQNFSVENNYYYYKITHYIFNYFLQQWL